MCDLKTFTDLRRASGDPLDVGEIFLIMEYLVDCMRKLHSIGVSLCDTKEQNILIKYSSSQQEMGYVPVLTDLGGIFCKNID
jgi:serine/threonine protein kinase